MKAHGGGDPTKAIHEGIEDLGKRITREAMTIWNTESQKRVMEAAQGRTDLDDTRDQRGSLSGREENDLHEIADSFTAPYWDDEQDRWVFAVTHRFADVHEWGAQPHEIKAKQAQALVFEWPDAPKEVREQFEDTFPKVFFDSVEHPGVPGIGFLRYGRAKARDRLQDAGFDTEEFAEKLDDNGGDE